MHVGGHDGEGECFQAIRSSDDGKALSVPFVEGEEVVVHPRVEWRLGSVCDSGASTVVVLMEREDGKLQMVL